MYRVLEWMCLRFSISKLLGPIDDYLTQYDTINDELKHAAKSELNWRGCDHVVDCFDQISNEPTSNQHQTT